MSLPEKVTSEKSISAIAEEIRREHEAVEAGIRATVAAAIRCGALLAEAKLKVSHGEWYGWLEANFPGTPKTAAAYMRLAANREQIEHAGSIRGALAQLAAPKEDRGDRGGNDHLDAAREHIAAADDCYRRAFEVFEERGIRFHSTGAEFPDNLTWDEWRQLADVLLTGGLDKVSPAALWDLGDAFAAIGSLVQERIEELG